MPFTRVLFSSNATIIHNALTYFLLISALYLVSKTLWRWILYPRYRSPLRHLPQAPGASLLMGHFWEMFRTHPGIVLRRWTREVPNEGLIRYLDAFNMERIAVVKPEALADVLVHKCYCFEKPAPLRKGISRILGMGLFLAEGDEHKSQRKNLMPAFAFKHLKGLYPIFWAKSQELVSAVALAASDSHNSAVEVNSWSSRAALDIIGVAGMGYDFNAIKDPDSELLNVYKSLFSPSRAGQILAIVGLFLPAWVIRALPIKRNNDIKHSSAVIRKHCMSLIELKKQKIGAAKDFSQDIIEVALKSGFFSDQDLVDQLMTFLVAGHETTASAMTWVMYLLSKHPNVQTKLREEVTSAIPDQRCRPETITSTTIDGLRYLQAVCNEALRLFPPVALTVRVSVQDTMVAGQYIPKGTGITLPPWAVNVNEKLWGANAEEFVPERWLDSSGTVGSNSNFSFMTFLHGPRSCIGEKFARGELACLVAAWAAAFDTRLADEDFVPEIRGGITAKPLNGLHVKIKLLD